MTEANASLEFIKRLQQNDAIIMTRTKIALLLVPRSREATARNVLWLPVHRDTKKKDLALSDSDDDPTWGICIRSCFNCPQMPKPKRS